MAEHSDHASLIDPAAEHQEERVGRHEDQSESRKGIDMRPFTALLNAFVITSFIDFQFKLVSQCLILIGAINVCNIIVS